MDVYSIALQFIIGWLSQKTQLEFWFINYRIALFFLIKLEST